MIHLPEPWRVKVIEPIRLPEREEREEHLRAAGLNLFSVPSEAIFVDLLTDSGTSALSHRQWAGLVSGDEAYAGGRSYYRFEKTVRDIFGLEHVIPVHQGRAGERLLFSTILEPGMIVPSNHHFDTTRANIETAGGIARDLGIPEATDPVAEHPFKGNMDIEALEALLADEAERVPLVLLTITNNSVGGQPVSMANLAAVAECCRAAGVALWIDACRFAENAYLVREREEGWQGSTIPEIVAETFRLADGCLMSAKKDGLANIGGFIATRDRALAERLEQQLVVTEGFPTYGGLAGRDLEAVATGLEEVLDERYLSYRIQQVRWFGEELVRAGIPLVRPIGGHAVYLDAGSLLAHVPPRRYPGQALTVELYRQGGIRGVEIGSVMFGRFDADSGELIPAELELVRLAVPRRVYSAAHLGYVVEVLEEVAARAEEIRGLRMTHAPPVLRHFTARFEEVDADEAAA